jgi:hypothetical protein
MPGAEIRNDHRPPSMARLIAPASIRWKVWSGYCAAG